MLSKTMKKKRNILKRKKISEKREKLMQEKKFKNME